MWFSTEELKITHRTQDWIVDDNKIGFDCHGDIHNVIFLTAMWFDEQREEIIAWGGYQDTEIIKIGINLKKLMEDKLIPCPV